MDNIETKRLLMRPLQLDDLDDLFALYGDSELMKYITGHPRDYGTTYTRLKAHIADHEAYGFGLCAAIQAQLNLWEASWNELGELKVRVGIHTGEAQPDPGGGEYAVSHTKNRAARIMSAAHGGLNISCGASPHQVLLMGNIMTCI